MTKGDSMGERRKVGGAYSRITAGIVPKTSRYSPLGTPEEWSAALNRFWSGKLNPAMKDIRRISHLNPRNIDNK